MLLTPVSPADICYTSTVLDMGPALRGASSSLDLLCNTLYDHPPRVRLDEMSAIGCCYVGPRNVLSVPLHDDRALHSSNHHPALRRHNLPQCRSIHANDSCQRFNVLQLTQRWTRNGCPTQFGHIATRSGYPDRDRSQPVHRSMVTLRPNSTLDRLHLG